MHRVAESMSVIARLLRDLSAAQGMYTMNATGIT